MTLPKRMARIFTYIIRWQAADRWSFPGRVPSFCPILATMKIGAKGGKAQKFSGRTRGGRRQLWGQLLAILILWFPLVGLQLLIYLMHSEAHHARPCTCQGCHLRLSLLVSTCTPTRANPHIECWEQCHILCFYLVYPITNYSYFYYFHLLTFVLVLYVCNQIVTFMCSC